MSEISEKETVSQDVSVAIATLSKDEIRLKKLKGLHLTNVKRRMGKPRTTKRLDRYKYSPKQFLKKGNHEKVTMFLSWVTGNERAYYLLDSKENADIKDFRSTNLMSPALFENDVNSVLKSFEYLFTTETWDQLVKHINEQRKVDVDYVCSTCQQCVLKNLKLKNGTRKEEPWIFCDCCQIWYHYCCENLKRKPNCQTYVCKSCRKHKL
ncbi:hypothetical protein DAPPUDRAFT_333359 [Daphnia pulex]|uniref:Zinc finger PHD-type domain-containing protein n=1 Tax=Daphnia pulex TaxID=6669 RepID=E9HSM2_DAPPU|nr:hypothetical protein DAPPUDRAFT_333359 [Daphnia pulex]|eukprot:EFX65264.1 hypothetical protein DAPPUDRAFT_333359 [Daphnia pulex]